MSLQLLTTTESICHFFNCVTKMDHKTILYYKNNTSKQTIIKSRGRSVCGMCIRLPYFFAHSDHCGTLITNLILCQYLPHIKNDNPSHAKYMIPYLPLFIPWLSLFNPRYGLALNLTWEMGPRLLRQIHVEIHVSWHTFLMWLLNGWRLYYQLIRSQVWIFFKLPLI